ncbi:MAG: PepSY-associated TM helix domain-containing protein [Bacteroidota bacterium]
MKGNKLIWKIHSWVGLYAGVAIAFLSVTGAAALFRIELDQLFNASLRKVEITGEKIPLTPIVEKVLAAHPDKYLFEVELPKEQNGSWNLRLFPIEKRKLFPVIWEVFVNPYNGEILGERNYYRTFNYYLRNIHVRFYEGFFGRQIVGLAGLALLISTITGFLIYGKFMKKQFFGNIRKKNLRVSQADYHKLIGITTLSFNLMIAITGAWLGLQTYLQKWLAIERPNTFVRTEKPIEKVIDRDFVFNYDSVYQAARQNFPELIPLYLRPSENGSRTVMVIGDVPRQAYERNSNKIVFDKENYSMLYKYNISDDDFGGKLFYVQESFHFGDFGGIWLKLFYCFLALTSGFLALSGFIIYLKRAEKKRKEKPSFVELKPLLIRWSGIIIGFCIFTGMLSLIWGIGIPTLIVMITFYGFLLFLVIKTSYKVIKGNLQKPINV